MGENSPNLVTLDAEAKIDLAKAHAAPIFYFSMNILRAEMLGSKKWSQFRRGKRQSIEALSKVVTYAPMLGLRFIDL
jgi:hypothetical protein